MPRGIPSRYRLMLCLHTPSEGVQEVCQLAITSVQDEHMSEQQSLLSTAHHLLHTYVAAYQRHNATVNVRIETTRFGRKSQ
jgi:hypothetical protein